MDNKDITFFAKTNFRGKDNLFGIKNNDRRQHMYVIGKTGTGKTTLLKNMALQDISNNRGVCIIDPHSEFVEEVLDKIPSSRINDVIYLNPADSDYPIAFNILEVPNPKYKHLIASNLMGVFTKIWANVWSARMEYILDNCVLALLDTPGTTLLGILRILVDEDYRQKIIDNLKDPVVKSFWINEYGSWREQFRNEAIAPIQNKVGQFLNTSLIRNIVGQSKSTINLSEIMDKQKILLVNLAKGRIGEDSSSLLGAMIVTRIQLAAMERVRIPEEERKDFYLYIDEFQNFATESFASILSEARKYHLNLIVTHQYIAQMDESVSDAVFGNIGTLVSFRVGATDAEFLEKEFYPQFNIQDLVNLPNFNIYLKLMIDGVASHPFSATTLPSIEKLKDVGNKEKIIKISRERYSKPRKEVEERITKWSGLIDIEKEEKPKENKYKAVCSICGKPTYVKFKPDNIRPIYCPVCLEKIKNDKIKPIVSKVISSEESEHIAEPHLKIEKEEPREGKLFKGIEDKKEAPSSISMEQALKKKTMSFKRKKKEVNIKELKEVLDQSLKKVSEKEKPEQVDGEKDDSEKI
ncbi:MAG: type IV secretion system DNA-binding domain-containing protein [Patescibacteria group bacterium]|nr:type IV secretion system DNA-binding domain-containing protein [Patescibacteria group bacterium]